MFTYPGVGEDSAEGLWIVVMTEDPAANSYYRMDEIYVVDQGGTLNAVDVTEWSEALSNQNELREENGLPALPDPRQLKHDEPALSTAAEIAEGGGTDDE